MQTKTFYQYSSSNSQPKSVGNSKKWSWNDSEKYKFIHTHHKNEEKGKTNLTHTQNNFNHGNHSSNNHTSNNYGGRSSSTNNLDYRGSQ